MLKELISGKSELEVKRACYKQEIENLETLPEVKKYLDLIEKQEELDTETGVFEDNCRHVYFTPIYSYNRKNDPDLKIYGKCLICGTFNTAVNEQPNYRIEVKIPENHNNYLDIYQATKMLLEYYLLNSSCDLEEINGIMKTERIINEVVSSNKESKDYIGSVRVLIKQ